MHKTRLCHSKLQKIYVISIGRSLNPTFLGFSLEAIYGHTHKNSTLNTKVIMNIKYYRIVSLSVTISNQTKRTRFAVRTIFVNKFSDCQLFIKVSQHYVHLTPPWLCWKNKKIIPRGSRWAVVIWKAWNRLHLFVEIVSSRTISSSCNPCIDYERTQIRFRNMFVFTIFAFC